jgi:hypothetical protein
MIMRFRGGGVGHKSTRTATDQFLGDRDRAERIRRGEDSRTADQDDEPARECEAESQQPRHEIEPRIEDGVDLEDEPECDYGYSKQVVDGDEDEDGWQDEDEDLGFLLDDELGAEDGEGDDEDLGFGEF